MKKATRANTIYFQVAAILGTIGSLICIFYLPESISTNGNLKIILDDLYATGLSGYTVNCWIKFKCPCFSKQASRI